MKLTIKQYAENEGISVQSVYARIKRGSLNSIEEDGIKYVLLEDTSVKPKVDKSLKEAFKIIKRQDKQIKDLHKEIKRLTKELSRAKDGKAEVLEKFIFEMQQLQAPEEEIIEIKPKKKDKKKRKKGKK